MQCSSSRGSGASEWILLQFVAKIVWTNTAEIDQSGNFWYIKKFGTQLFQVQNIAGLEGYSSHSEPSLPDYSGSSGWVYDLSADQSSWQQTGSELSYADLTYVSADIGEGIHSYLLALSTEKSSSGATQKDGVLLVIRITGENLRDGRYELMAVY